MLNSKFAMGAKLKIAAASTAGNFPKLKILQNKNPKFSWFFPHTVINSILLKFSKIITILAKKKH